MIYEINKRTKKHRVHMQGCPSSQEEEFVEADADGWIEWRGDGECPLPGDATCDAETEMMRYQGVLAKTLQWVKVKRYRPILDTKPEAPEWDGEGLPPVGCDVHWANADAEDHTFTVVAHDEDMVICHNPWDTDNRYIWGYASDFYPIRSEEDRFVDQVNEVMKAEELYSLDRHARALFRAGVRFTEEAS